MDLIWGEIIHRKGFLETETLSVQSVLIDHQVHMGPVRGAEGDRRECDSRGHGVETDHVIGGRR